MGVRGGKRGRGENSFLLLLLSRHATNTAATPSKKRHDPPPLPLFLAERPAEVWGEIGRGGETES